MQEDEKDDALAQMAELHKKLVDLNSAALALEDFLATDWDEGLHEQLVEALEGNLSIDRDELQVWVEVCASETQEFLDSSDKAQREAGHAPVDEEEEDEDGDSEAS